MSENISRTNVQNSHADEQNCHAELVSASGQTLKQVQGDKNAFRGDATPLITVIIPVYNSEKYLRKCLDSVVGQTYKNLEIVCVNDGSTDKSGEILREYAERDGRIVVIEQENGGRSAARNAGMRVASGEWIAFVDSDDWIEKNAYEICSKSFSFDVDWIFFGVTIRGCKSYEQFSSDLKYYRVQYGGFQTINDNIRLKCDVSVCNKLWRREIIEREKIDFPVGRNYEDFPFFLKYSFCAKTAFFFGNKFYNYVRHEGSIMADTFAGNAKATDHLFVFKDLFDFLQKRDLVSAHLDALADLFVSCFWFAFANCGDKLLACQTATRLLRVFDLDEDAFCDANLVIKRLRLGDYSLWLSQKAPNVYLPKKTLLQRSFDYIKANGVSKFCIHAVGKLLRKLKLRK